MKKLALISLVMLAVSGCSSEGGLAWLDGWKKTSQLNIQRAGMAVVESGGVVYVIGGVDGRNFLRTTEFARINSDGSLGAWQMGPLLNEERGFLEADVHDGYIYVAGGGNGPYGKHLLRSIEKAKILADGTLGPWVREENSMIVARRCSKIMIKDDHIYSFAGYGGALLDTVERSQIGVDGSLGEWVMEEPVMTELRYVNGGKILGDYVYITGGHDMVLGTGIQAVEFAKFRPDGSLSTWQQTAPLLTGRYGLGSAKFGKYLYAMGGVTGAEYLESVEVSQSDTAGYLAEWRYTTSLSEPLTTFGVITYQDKIYVIGGANRDGYRRTVEYAEINDKGDIGFYATEEEVANYKAIKEQQRIAAENLPNSGVVVEVVNTQVYSYIYAKRDDGSHEWLAGPKVTVYPGERIKYSTGVYMSNFYSKELNRNFPSVLFVGQLRIAQ